MRAYGKTWSYNVFSCRYCRFWKGSRFGCIYPTGCCCPIAQKPEKRFGVTVQYQSSMKQTVTKSECDGCPYGCDSPCIGWCDKKVIKAVGLPREKNI